MSPKLQRTIKKAQRKPETCGECDRYSEDVYDSENDQHIPGLGWCIPMKPKYGHEPVKGNQKPSINCPLGK